MFQHFRDKFSVKFQVDFIFSAACFLKYEFPHFSQNPPKDAKHF